MAEDVLDEDFIETCKKKEGKYGFKRKLASK